MARRRMISRDIVKSGNFLKMPTSSQLLYFHLVADADDDGVVEAYATMEQTKAAEDDLKMLVAKEYVKVLNEDLVSYIQDWHTFNKVTARKKYDSVHRSLLLTVFPELEAELVVPKRRSDVKNPSNIKHLDSKRTVRAEIVNDGLNDLSGPTSLVQSSLVQSSLVQDSLLLQDTMEPEKKMDKDPYTTGFYGKHENVFLLPEEWEVVSTWEHADQVIDNVSEAIHVGKANGKVSHFKLLEREAEALGRKERGLCFGTMKNLEITQSDFEILDRRFDDLKANLDFLADKVYGTTIHNPLSYILTVARNEKWKGKKDPMLQQAQQRREEAQKARENQEWYAQKMQEYGVSTKEEVDRVFDEENRARIEDAKRKLQRK